MKSIPYLACNFIYLLLLASPLMAENTLQKIDALIESKQCRSALAEVQTADPESEKFEYFLRKLDISLNCNVRHIHGTELFGFTDLQPGETLEDLRGRPPVRQYIVHGWSIREKIKAFEDKLAHSDRFSYLAGQYFAFNCS
ncbi:MAG: hypothetical protein KDK23_14985, partial [Leptospiraceae bacterium]|nr:hypothetical protein [Leptospiraceae bacterium]